MEDPITSEHYESPRVSLNQHPQRKAKGTRASAGSIDQSIGQSRITPLPPRPAKSEKRESRERERKKHGNLYYTG